MWVGLSVLLFVCQLDLFVVKKSLSKLFFSNHIRTLIANLSVSVRILFGQVDDTAFYESKGSIWGQKTVLSKLSLLHLSFAYLEGKSQGFFQKTVSRFVKTANHVSKMILWRSFFWKSSFFISSFGFERAFLVLCTNFCGSGCQYCFLFVNSASLWWKIFWQSFFLPSFWTLIANLSVFVQFFFNQVDDTVFYESERSIWRQTIVLTNILSLFSSFSNSERKKKVFFGGKPITRFVKPAYDLSRQSVEELFLRIGSFFAHHWHLGVFFSDISTKTSLRCRQNCFLSVHCNTLW